MMNRAQRISFRIFAFTLLLLFALFAAAQSTTGQSGEGPEPPPPPTWAESPFPPEMASSPPQLTSAQAGCENMTCQFLPLVSIPPSGLSRSQAVEIYNRLYVPSQNPPIGWYGSVQDCQPGTTSAAFVDAMKMRINYFREMAGIPPITTMKSDYNAMGQAAALMMSANEDLDHTPPTDWRCYTDLGSTGAGSSNLFLGMYGTVAIDGYIRDPGAGNTAAGHRRWILLPPTTNMGTGDIPNGTQHAANALRVFDPSNWNPRPATRDLFVAWPPSGYVPYNTVYPRWTFALHKADFSQSSVTVTHGDTVIPITLFDTVEGYGENTLVWQINGMRDWDSWSRPSGDDCYTVTVHNVLIDGTARDYTYTVTIFDPGY